MKGSFKNILLVSFCSFLFLGSTIKKDEFESKDYKVISFLINYCFKTHSFKEISEINPELYKSADTNEIIKLRGMLPPPIKVSSINVYENLTIKNFSSDLFIECDDKLNCDLKDPLEKYRHLNKKNFTFSVDSFNKKYLPEIRIKETKERTDPSMSFDRPYFFSCGTQNYAIVTFYEHIVVLNGNKSTYLINCTEESKYKIVCWKVLLVN